MILIRPILGEDEPRLKQMAADQGFDFILPTLDQISLGTIVEVDRKVEMALLLRPTVEAYLLLDKENHSKRDRIGKLLAIHKELIGPAKEGGLTDVHAWLPPEIEKRFGALLLHMGWRKSEWPCYFAEI